MTKGERVQSKLREMLCEVDDGNASIAFRDLFALGCRYHAEGNETVGWKACITALRAVGCSDAFEREFTAYLPGNERACFEAAAPHSEIKSLLKDFPEPVEAK